MHKNYARNICLPITMTMLRKTTELEKGRLYYTSWSLDLDAQNKIAFPLSLEAPSKFVLNWSIITL